MNNESSETINGNILAKNYNLRSLLKFATPTITMMIFSGLYTIVDTIFIAQFINTNALSAVNIVTPVIYVIVGLATMLATGGSAIIANKMGSGKDGEARQNFTLIVIMGIIIGLLIACFGLIFLLPIIRGLGATDLLFGYCRDYLFILLIFAPANILQVLFATFFVVAGKPKFGMALGFAAGITNAFFDFLFMKILQMGIRGAAIATGMGYMIPTVAGIIFFFRNKKGSLSFTKFKLDLKVLGQSCFNGSSEMIGMLSTSITTFLFNAVILKLLGEDGVAAVTIMIYSQFLFTSLFIGFSMGTAPIISYNHGSKNYLQLKKIVKICSFFILTVSLILFTFTISCGSFLIQVFTPKGTNVYSIARDGFLIFPFSFLFVGFNIFVSALFTALSNGKISLILSVLRTLIFISASILILPLFIGVTGVWLAVPIAELLTIFLSLFFILRYRQHYFFETTKKSKNVLEQ